MWTCPLVFCDFEKFAQKCLFVFAAADFPCTGAFHVSSACICRMENEVHPSQIRFKPCDEMHLVFRFPTRPTLCALGLRPACHPLLSCRLQPGSLLLVRMAFHNLSSVRVSIWLSASLVPPAGGVGSPPAFMYTCLENLLHLAMPVHPLPHGGDAPQSPVFGPPGPLRGLAAVASQAALPSQ